MRFTILGMGKTGHAAACYLLQAGHQVTIWDRDEQKVKTLADEGISIYGQVVGTFKPQAEQDIGKAVHDADYTLLFTTANGHKPIANLLQGCLQKGQRIIIFNGNWGALEFVQVLEQELKEKNILVAETGAQIFAASLQGTGRCYLKSLKKAVSLGCYPAIGAKIIADEMKSVFPQFQPVGSVLETSMNVSNPIAHCPLDLFNLAMIDSGHETLMFASGYTSPKGVTFTKHVDEERMALLKKVGVKGLSLLQLFNQSWNSSYEDLYTAFKGIKSYQTAKSPTSFDSRHFTEDIPFGIVPLQKLARKYEVPTPYIDALLTMYELVLGKKIYEGTPDVCSMELKKFLA